MYFAVDKNENIILSLNRLYVASERKKLKIEKRTVRQLFFTRRLLVGKVIAGSSLRDLTGMEPLGWTRMPFEHDT